MARRCHVPWLALFSALITGAGIGVWVHYTRRAIDNTESTLHAMDIETPSWWSWTPVAVYIAMGVAIGIMVLSLLISASRTCLPKTGKGSGRKTYLWSSGLTNFLLWLVLLVVVLLVGWYSVWLSAAVVVDRVSLEANKVAKDAAGVVGDLNSALDQLIRVYDGNSARLPGDIQQAIGPQINQIRAFRNTSTCPSSCLDLSIFGDILPDFSKCICGEETLGRIRDHARTTWQTLIRASIGLMVTYVGMSWMVMRVVAEFTKTKTGRKDPEQDPGLPYHKPAGQYVQG